MHCCCCSNPHPLEFQFLLNHQLKGKQKGKGEEVEFSGGFFFFNYLNYTSTSNRILKGANAVCTT